MDHILGMCCWCIPNSLLFSHPVYKSIDWRNRFYIRLLLTAILFFAFIILIVQKNEPKDRNRGQVKNEPCGGQPAEFGA